jgi:amidophosphoribosyltransferase
LEKCLADQNKVNEVNYVKELYAPFSYDQVSQKIGEIVKPKKMKAVLEVVFQTVEGLHKACPDHLGDWYFTGDYPTKGGNSVVNTAFINFMKGVEVRAY